MVCRALVACLKLAALTSVLGQVPAVNLERLLRRVQAFTRPPPAFTRRARQLLRETAGLPRAPGGQLLEQAAAEAGACKESRGRGPLPSEEDARALCESGFRSMRDAYMTDCREQTKRCNRLRDLMAECQDLCEEAFRRCSPPPVEGGLLPRLRRAL
ncbi:unnamed protein product [Prorocentrum cordatum]|uniref:Uncharacterized protein n=1 Tax=Prorocentrum cordatum TaxID=2364126 RepID=A0ABN9UG99_9DINO|nr:unnamed protein product [Polarella glacialis]